MRFEQRGFTAQEKSKNESFACFRGRRSVLESAPPDQAAHDARIAAGMKARGLQWLNTNTRLSREV
jgi:hypothetical protein